jgi:chemotaxis protein methyltransferase CheR
MDSHSVNPTERRGRRSQLWQKMRHKLALRVSDRVNSHFTGFLRLPTQFEALTFPVIDGMLGQPDHPEPLEIAVLGCSNGSEAYTIASVLKERRPHLRFRITGFDIDSDCVRTAANRRYKPEEIYNNKIIAETFVTRTFDREGDSFVVNGDIAAHVQFALADVLSPDLLRTVGLCDVVFAQNFLFHLARPRALQALNNIASLLKPGSALFIDGTDLDLRHKFVRARGLVPLDYKIRTIHEEAGRARSVGWPDQYWGLEPFMTYPRDWKVRYATIFLAPPVRG